MSRLQVGQGRVRRPQSSHVIDLIAIVVVLLAGFISSKICKGAARPRGRSDENLREIDTA